MHKKQIPPQVELRWRRPRIEAHPKLTVQSTRYPNCDFVLEYRVAGVWVPVPIQMLDDEPPLWE